MPQRIPTPDPSPGGWPRTPGNSGRITVEQVAEYSWNQWPDNRGIRNDPTDPLNCVAPSNIQLIPTTESVFQSSRSWLKELASRNMLCIDVTELVSQPPIS